MSSILNGQSDTACIEAYPYQLFKSSYEFSEDLLCDLSIRESEFINLGIDVPQFKKARSSEDLITIYNQHVVDLFSVSNIGFKRTMLSLEEISKRVDEGYRVVIMRRDSKSILKSWVRRIDSDILNGAHRLSRYYSSINNFQFGDLAKSVIVVDYENLVENRKYELKKVSDFLNISIDADMTRYYSWNKNKVAFDNNSSFKAATLDSPFLNSLKEKYPEEIYVKLARDIDTRSFFSLKHSMFDILKNFYLTVKDLLK
jgi:hypothetical protein